MDEVLTLTLVQTPQTLSPNRIRLERIPRNKLDKKSILYEAKGPYQGIIIRKHTEELPTIRSPHALIEFTSHIFSKSDPSKRHKENRTFNFWFGKEVPIRDQTKLADDFSRLLLDPSTFPQDVYVFIKRMMMMVKERKYIHCLDLKVIQRRQVFQDDMIAVTTTVQHCSTEVRHTVMEAEKEEDSNAIRNFVTVLTPAQYDFQYVPEISVSKKSFLNFRIKASANAHIALSAVYGSVEQKTYEIVLGASQNSRCYIKDNAEGAIKAECITPNILDGNQLKDFWISWASGQIRVGYGPVRYRQEMLVWKVPTRRQHHVNCLAVATDNESTGHWEFVDMIYPSKNKEEIRYKARSSLLWMAKKQRLLNTLEDAYPEYLSTEELLRVNNIKQGDMMTAVVMLQDMQKRKLIREISRGKWMRMPGGLDIKGHDVRVVEDVPSLSLPHQPTVAIITALYCEKLAVDALITDKITYHKYSSKREGDTSVYTIGHIGKICVVSTKLARVGRGQFNTISAGNAITRLLGTFNKVEHAIMLGVGGGVPNPDDVNKHVRPGDVMVSYVEHPSSPIYTLCDKIQYDGENFDFVTKSWMLKNHFLQEIARELKTLQQCGDGHLPWDDDLDMAKEALKGEESGFYRPSTKHDRRYEALVNGRLMEFEHPQKMTDGRLGLPIIHYGPMAAGKFVTRNPRLRLEFAQLYNVVGYDYEFDAVLDSFAGNKLDSFIMIRGVSDYQDGLKSKEWQPYAALAAASYMKTLISNIENRV